MNEPTWMQEYAGLPLEEWPEELKSRVEANPEWREAVRLQAETARWIGMKRYELPDPAMEGRVRHRVGIRIRHGASAPRPLVFLDNLPDWARMTAAVVAMLGLSVMTHREMLSNGEESSAEGVAQAMAGAENPAPAEERTFSTLEAWDPAEATRPPAYLLNHEDPFVTTVRFPKGTDTSDFLFSPSTGLVEEWSASRSVLPVLQTNRAERARTQPVGFSAGPQSR